VSDQSVAGLVLVVGSSLFIIGAALPPEPSRVFSSPAREYLDILHRHASRWRVMNGLMIASVIGTAVGLWLFEGVVGNTGDLWRGLSGASAYSLGAVLWLAGLTFRNSATLHAAKTAAESGEIPAWFEPLGDWMGAMFRVYMILAYSAVAMFGWAVIDSKIASPGVGGFGVGFGVILGVSFVTGRPKTSFGSIADIPALIHVATLVYGVALL
jgi:hypothetical protein